MVCLATTISAHQSDERIRPLWEGRGDVKVWRETHDSWLTMHAEMGDNPKWVHQYRFPGTKWSKPILKKYRMLEQLFGPQQGLLGHDMVMNGNGVYNLGLD